MQNDILENANIDYAALSLDDIVIDLAAKGRLHTVETYGSPMEPWQNPIVNLLRWLGS